MGHWDGHTASVPTTLRGERFGGWDDVDAERPMLMRERGSDETLAEKGQAEVLAKNDGPRPNRTSIVVQELS